MPVTVLCDTLPWWSAAARILAAVGRPPLPVRFALAAVACGVLGALLGLVLGLRSYPATAWFAALEVGVPAALLGAVVGLVVGSVTWLFRRADARTAGPRGEKSRLEVAGRTGAHT